MRILFWIKEFFQSKHIQLALVSGVSIIALAYFSKRVLEEPVDKLYMSIPALLVTMGEGFISKKTSAWYTNVYLWMAAVAASTILIIVLHLV